MVFKMNEKDELEKIKKAAFENAAVEYADYVLKTNRGIYAFGIVEYSNFQKRLCEAAFEYIKSTRK